MNYTRLFAAILSTVLLVSCGGGHSSPPPAPTLYSIGGNVTGLTSGASVQLATGSQQLTVTSATSFSFPSPVASQTAYAVTVSTQPSGQICGVQNGTGTVAAANITNIVVACTTPLAGGTGMLMPSGGTVTTPAATITAPPTASLTVQNVTIASVAPPAGMPSALTAVGAAVDISIDNAASLNAPLVITLPYDPTGIANENNMAVLHYNTTKNLYEPVTVLSHDTTTHTFQIESRTFSPFVVVTIATAMLDASHTVTGFTPTNNGWNINNFGSYYTPGGNCLGMSAYATWYFDNSNTPSLNGVYSASGSPSIAQLVAIRTQLAQSQYWAAVSNTSFVQLGAAGTAALMQMYLDVFDKPLILLLGVNGKAQHASVLYGYNASGFQFYDVNSMGTSQTVSFDGTNFGTYSGYNTFTYVAVPSLGRTEDFAALTTEALAGFTSSSLISVTSPTPGQQIAALSVDLSGSLSSSINSAASMIAYVEGVPQLIAPSAGAFSATLPISSGDNTIVLLAGENISQQSNWYANAATLIFDVTGTLPPTTLLTTLTWDQDNTDVDLYVTEPSPSGQTAWFSNLQTSNLLTLDFDNTVGFGPEHTTLTTTGPNPGTALPGLYSIAVHYYSDHGTGQAVTGNVSIVVNEGMPNASLSTKGFSIATSDDNNYAPGSTGPDWVEIGTVDLINGIISLNSTAQSQSAKRSVVFLTNPHEAKLPAFHVPYQEKWTIPSYYGAPRLQPNTKGNSQSLPARH